MADFTSFVFPQMALPGGSRPSNIPNHNSSCSSVGEPPDGKPSTKVSELVLLGTGVSTGLPRISCVLRGRPDYDGPDPSRTVPCVVCNQALRDPLSRNRRGNVSALVRLGDWSVMIDAGKTMRETCMRFLPALGVLTVDAIVLTHGHADAILGLDDLRDLQDVKKQIRVGSTEVPHAVSTPVFLNKETMSDCQRCFPYMMSSRQLENGIKRRVADVDWRVYDRYFRAFRPVAEADIEFIPVPLLHGGDYICAGYVIKSSTFAQKSIIAYLSDVSLVPNETMAYLRELPRLDVLIIDSLLRHRAHSSHFSLDQAIELARNLRPSVTRCVGMTCSLGLHDLVDTELVFLKESEGLDIRLGYDGMRIPL